MEWVEWLQPILFLIACYACWCNGFNRGTDFGIKLWHNMLVYQGKLKEPYLEDDDIIKISFKKPPNLE